MWSLERRRAWWVSSCSFSLHVWTMFWTTALLATVAKWNFNWSLWGVSQLGQAKLPDCDQIQGHELAIITVRSAKRAKVMFSVCLFNGGGGGGGAGYLSHNALWDRYPRTPPAMPLYPPPVPRPARIRPAPHPMTRLPPIPHPPTPPPPVPIFFFWEFF